MGTTDDDDPANDDATATDDPAVLAWAGVDDDDDDEEEDVGMVTGLEEDATRTMGGTARAVLAETMPSMTGDSESALAAGGENTKARFSVRFSMRTRWFNQTNVLSLSRELSATHSVSLSLTHTLFLSI